MARRHASTAALLAALTAFALPTAADAKTYRANLHVQGKAHGAAVNVTVSGSPLGRCSGTGRITRAGTTYNLRCRGGRIRMRSKATTGLADRSRGRWQMLGGTGRYQRISGAGTFRGRLSTGSFSCTGTVRY